MIKTLSAGDAVAQTLYAFTVFMRGPENGEIRSPNPDALREAGTVLRAYYGENSCERHQAQDTSMFLQHCLHARTPHEAAIEWFGLISSLQNQLLTRLASVVSENLIAQAVSEKASAPNADLVEVFHRAPPPMQKQIANLALALHMVLDKGRFDVEPGVPSDPYGSALVSGPETRIKTLRRDGEKVEIISVQRGDCQVFTAPRFQRRLNL